jgi:streptogramin lyase
VILGRFTAVFVFVCALGALIGAGSAGAVTITEFPADPGNFSSTPEQIVGGPEGKVWWTEGGAKSGIGRISTNGELFPAIETSRQPVDLVVAPSGWASWTADEGIGTRDPSGFVHTYDRENFSGGAITLTPAGSVRYGYAHFASTAVCAPGDLTGDHLKETESCYREQSSDPTEGMAAAPDGRLWVSVGGAIEVFGSEGAPSKLKRIDLPANSAPRGIAIGPEGDAWVAMFEADAIDRLAPDGSRTRFKLPAGSHPYDIVWGPDGAFWMVEAGTGKIGRMSTAGVLTDEYPVPSGETGQSGIAVGPDGNIWFTDTEMGEIGRLVPDPVLGPVGSLPVAPVGGGPAPARDTTAPRFLGATTFSPTRFAVVGAAKASAKGHAGAPAGSKLKFSLSEAGAVTATISAKARGRRSGKSCVAPAKAPAKAAKCTRLVRKGALALSGAAGPNKLAFSGKVGGKALAPGAYQAALVARDAAGNASAPSLAGFTVLG